MLAAKLSRFSGGPRTIAANPSSIDSGWRNFAISRTTFSRTGFSLPRLRVRARSTGVSKNTAGHSGDWASRCERHLPERLCAS